MTFHVSEFKFTSLFWSLPSAPFYDCDDVPGSPLLSVFRPFLASSYRCTGSVHLGGGVEWG